MPSLLDNCNANISMDRIKSGEPNQAFLEQVDRIINESLKEDIGTGDLTSLATIPAHRVSRANLYIKEPAVIAGLSIFLRVLQKLDSAVVFEPLVSDGTYISETPYLAARVHGQSLALLAGERTALNLMQRLSGIATMTRQFVDLAKPYGIHILDTRKTMPGLRILDKWAVAAGGGDNHRFGLFDLILIKDNHINVAGGVTAAVNKSRAANPGRIVEVEVANQDQLQEALNLKVERIMLDNMTPAEVRRAVDFVAGAAFIEVSGGINLSNIRDYLIPGVNAISVGALTHSVKCTDISLKIED